MEAQAVGLMAPPISALSVHKPLLDHSVTKRITFMQHYIPVLHTKQDRKAVS